MSIPTQKLGKLPFREDMPTTRAQAQRDRERERERLRIRSQGIQDDVLPSIESPIAGPIYQAASPPDTPIRGHTGYLYDVQHLSPDAMARASEGLASSNFVVNRPQLSGSAQDSYYAFQMFQPFSVRIFNPTSDSRSVQCSCQDYSNTKLICPHIYWLFDGLNAILAPRSPASYQQITQDGVLAQIANFYGQIGANLESISERINNGYSPSLPEQFGGGRDVEATAEYGESGEIDDSTRNEIIRDMLSIFSIGSYPTTYRSDLFSDAPTSDTPFEELFVPQDLDATIYRLASYDKVFYKHLRGLLTRDRCALQTFHNLGIKARSFLDRLNRFYKDGPNGPAPVTPISISQCGEALRLIVEQIRVYKNQRGHLGAFGQAVLRKAAEVLVQILASVCGFNRDLYAEITWDRTGPYVTTPDDEDDRNLYVYLIGDTPYDEDSEVEPWLKNDFILEILEELPPETWNHLYERLTAIRAFIQRDLLEHDWHDHHYLERLDEIVGQTAEIHDDPMSAVRGHSRHPTFDFDRETQRRRLE